MCQSAAPAPPRTRLPGEQVGIGAPPDQILPGGPPRGPQLPAAPMGTTPPQKQPAGKQPPIVPPPGGWPTSGPLNDPNRYSSKSASEYPNGVGTPTPVIKPPGAPAGIDYSAYKGTTPMDVYGRNPNGLPVGWDWDAYTAATGTKTHDEQGRPLDNTGKPITWGFDAAYGQPTNGTAGPPPNPSGGNPVGTPTPPPMTPPGTPPPPATPATPVPGQPVNSGVEQLVPPPPPVNPVQGQPVNSGVEQLVPAPILPPITQPSVPKMGIAAPTFAPGGAPTASGSPVVNALMKRYRKNLWDF